MKRRWMMLLWLLFIPTRLDAAGPPPIPSVELYQIGRGTALGFVWRDGDLLIGGSGGHWLYEPTFTESPTHWQAGKAATFLTWGGARMATLSRYDTVRIWDEGAESPLWEVQLPREVTALALSDDGAFLAVGTGDSILRIFEANSGRLLALLREHTDPIRALAWNGDGWLAAGDDGGHILIWEGMLADWGVNSRAESAHDGAVLALDWRPDDNGLASGGFDHQIHLWEFIAAAPLTQYATLEGHPARLRALDWSPDGRRIASASGHIFTGSEVRIWEVESGQTERLFSGRAAMTQVAWSPDGRQLAARGEDHLVRVWNAADGAAIGTLNGHTGSAEDVDWYGEELAVAYDDGTLRLWYGQQSTAIFQGHLGGLNSVSWSPNGEWLASGSWDDTVRVWSRAGGKTYRILQGHTARVWSVDWHPDGRRLLSAGRDATVRVWDAFSGQELRVFTGPQADVLMARWSPDGTQIAASSDDGSVWIWDAQTGETRQELNGHYLYTFAVDWRPRQDQVASGSWYDGSVQVWNLATGTWAAKMSSVQVFSLAWHPSGDVLASADSKGVIRIWQAQGQHWGTVRVLEGHRGRINALRWNSDGSKLASAGADGTIRVWGSPEHQSTTP